MLSSLATSKNNLTGILAATAETAVTITSSNTTTAAPELLFHTDSTIMSSAVVVPSWVHVCTVLAPAASIIVFLAPLPTMHQIAHDKSVGTLPLMPYSSMFMSTVLWMTYGFLKQQPSIWTSNLVGWVLAIYYLYKFIQFSPKAAPTLPGSVSQHLRACGIVAAVTWTLAVLPTYAPSLALFGTGKFDPSVPIGMAGVIFCLAMFASPLAALKIVLQTKSAVSIPLPFTIASTLNCVLWTVSGLWEMHDPNVYFTNGLALLFGIAQIALKLKFGSGPEKHHLPK